MLSYYTGNDNLYGTLPCLSAFILVARHVESLKIVTELVLELESHGIVLVRRHVIVRLKVDLINDKSEILKERTFSNKILICFKVKDLVEHCTFYMPSLESVIGRLPEQGKKIYNK